MSYIYYRESTKNFPPLGHPLIPPLFIEAGKMPCSSQDKAKSCIILINLAGIYFLRPEKLKKTYKISKFLSSFLITEVVYDEKKRTIRTKHDSVYIQCPHMDEAIALLVSSRKFLLQKLYDKSPVKFTDFPTQPIANPNMHVGASLLTLQYICYCIQHDVTPDDIGIIPNFQKFDPYHHSIMFFDEFCLAPSHLNCLCGPIHFLESITTLHFSNFAPYSACRIIHKIMRHQLRIRNFILDGYQHLVPEQLRLKKFSPKGLISIVIQNCRLPEETMIKLFNELGEYQGEVQRLSLINVELTDKSWKELLTVLTTCRAFRTLEIFELEKIDASQFYEDQLHDDILTISKHCRFIQRFSISLWAQPQLLTCIEPFFVNSFLFELILRGQNITQPFSNSLKLPRQLHYLDFSGCNFTYISLKSLFSFLAKTPDHNPITLNLADIMLPSAQWHQFYQELSTVSHLNYIGELDWSGNIIDPLFIRDTVSLFFTMNPIRFLTIDRVFGNNNYEDFCTFFSAIPHGKLKGLSIGGSAEHNFSGNFAQLFKGISPVCPLNILHLVGQKMQPEDIQPLMSYLGENSSFLLELFIDDTSLPSALKLYEFYQSIFNLHIPIIGRPDIDLERLFGSKTFGDLNNADELKKFREQIVQLPSAASKSARAYYISRNQAQKGFDANQYITFIQRYPACFFDPDDIDPFQLQFKSQKAILPSLLFLLRGKKDIRSLSELHAACLVEPNKLPLYMLPPKFSNGTTLDSGFNDYDNQNNYKAMNQLSTFTHQSSPYSAQTNFGSQQQITNNNNQQQQNQGAQQQNNYDQQFTPDPNFLNQGYDQQFTPDPNFLNQGYDSQFTPDPYFLQNQQDSQFLPQPLEQLEPLKPNQQLPQLEPLQTPPPQLEPLQPSPQLEQLQPPPQLEPLQELPQLESLQTPPPQLEPLQPSPQLEQLQPPPQLEPLQELPQLESLQTPPPQLEPLQPSPQLEQLQPPPQLESLQAPPQLEPFQPLSSDSQQHSDFSSSNLGFDSQIGVNPVFLNQDQFQFDPQFIPSDPDSSNLFSAYDPNQEFNPQFIQDPSIDMMYNSQNNTNNIDNNTHQEKDINITQPPTLHDSSDGSNLQQDQNLFIPPPPSFTATPLNEIGSSSHQQEPELLHQSSNEYITPPLVTLPEQTPPPPPFDDTEQQQQPNLFIPPPPDLIQSQIEQPQETIPPPPPFQEDQNQNQIFNPPPPFQEDQTQQQLFQPTFIPENSLQSNIFIPPPPDLIQPQIEQPQETIPPPQEETQQQQQTIIYHTIQEQPQQQSFIPPPLQSDQNQPQLQPAAIPPPLLSQSQFQSAAIPPPLHASENQQQLRSSLTPPPLQVTQIHPQAPTGFIPPPLNAGHDLHPLRSSLPTLSGQPPDLANTTAQPSGLIPPPLQPVSQMPVIPPPQPDQSQLDQQQQREKELQEQQQREKELQEQQQREKEQQEREKEQQEREKELLEQQQREKEMREQQEREKLIIEQQEQQRKLELREQELKREEQQRREIELHKQEAERERELREQEEKREKELREQQEQIEAEKQFSKTQVVKNRGWSYAPNEPRRGPPVLIQKLTLTSKKAAKKNRFQSAAGLFDLPRLPNYSKQPITASNREVSIPQSGKVTIPNPAEILNEQQPQRPEFKSFEDVDIPDLISFKSISSNEKKREYKVFDHSYEDSAAAFYNEQNGKPFQLLQPTPGYKIVVSDMAHPLEKRKRIEFPHVKILGVPSEW